MHILEYRRDSRTASLSLLVYNINKAKREKRRRAVFTPTGPCEIPIGHSPRPAGCTTPASHAGRSPHLPLLIIELSSFPSTLLCHSASRSSHPVGTLWLPGAHTMLSEIQLISPGTAFVFKTAKCQLRHKNAERSQLRLCWRGGSCCPGHSRHWGVSWRAGAQHDSVTP